MALEYLKLAHATEQVSSGEITKAALLALIEAGERTVVNLKGRMLTAAQVDDHLTGRVDGETVVRT
jgi:hypothetical protein